jgi:hypothetical protein
MHQVSMPLARTTDAPNIQAEAATGAAALRPALFARYGALARLRYDFPLVLVEGDGDGPVLRPLTGIIDGILRETAAPGADGEALRQQVLRARRAGHSGQSLAALRGRPAGREQRARLRAARHQPRPRPRGPAHRRDGD